MPFSREVTGGALLFAGTTMRFLTSTESEDWCLARRLEPVSRKFGPPASRKPRFRFRIPSDAGRRVALCCLLWQNMVESENSQRLLWIVEWSVWPSGEHFPLFARLRRSCGEHRSLGEVPGHLFERGEDDDGISFFVIATLFLWDCSLYSDSGIVIDASNDEFGAVSGPTTQAMANLKRALEKLQVLE